MGLDNSSTQNVNNYNNCEQTFVTSVASQSPFKKASDAYNYDNSGFDPNLQKYLNEKSITEMIQINSEISRILSKFKISIKINMKILDNLIHNHLPQTTIIALGIADNLPKTLKSKVNVRSLKKATSLHDIAKVIIPENIINKAGRLTDSEREIMQEHSVLSYEMLKTTDLDSETLNLIKNHHQNPQKTGYPRADKDFVSDINLQLLSIADVYSALKEKRCYKPAMSTEKALSIIQEEVEKGKFHPQVFNALKEYVSKTEPLNNSNSQRQTVNLKPINGLSA